MKFSRELLLILIFSFLGITANSQRFKAGIYSGINFSDIHGQDYGGKWKSLTGPSVGLSFRYNFLKPFTLVTGIGYYGINYKYTSYSYPYYPFPDFWQTYYNSIIAPVEHSGTVTNFGFTRIPLKLEIQIPSRLNFHLGAGAIFSFSGKGNSSQNYMYYYSPVKSKKQDFDYLFSAGWDYPLTDKLDAGVEITYVTGRKAIFENNNSKHGYSEINFGIGYKFGKGDNNEGRNIKTCDSISSSVLISYFAGPSFSWIKDTEGKGGYLPLAGFNMGFNLIFPMKGGASFITGAHFESTGYGLKDSSNLYFLIAGDSRRTYYTDTRVSTERLVVPLLLDIQLGKSNSVFLNTGPFIGLKLNGRNTGTAVTESRYESSYSVRKITVYDDMEKVLTDFDTGWILGGSVLFPFNSGYTLKVSLSYYSCFSDFYEKSSLYKITSIDGAGSGLKRRNLSLSIGILIPSANMKGGKR